MNRDSQTQPVVFISYSHNDESWKDRLITHLGFFKSQDLIDLWDDQRIEPGSDWHQEIQEAMDVASIAILLISADFLSSDFILSTEIPHLLQRRDEEGLRIFPVIVSPCAWKRVEWLAQMQVRPRDGRPLSSGDPHHIDAELTNITEEIIDIVENETDELQDVSSCPDAETHSIPCYVAATGTTLQSQQSPKDLHVPAGLVYLEQLAGTKVHHLYRMLDQQIVILIPADFPETHAFLIDKYQTTCKQYVECLNDLMDKSSVEVQMRNGSVKVAVDEQDRTLVVDALDQWQTNYRQPEWRFSAPPWGVTYQEPHWIPLSGSERLPVTLVTWWGAKLYSLWAYGMEEMYKNQETFLPLEEQWEWAAMWDPNSRSTRRFPWGEHWAQRHVNSLSYWVDQEAPDYVHRNTLLKEDASLAARVQPVEVDRFEDGASATGCVQMLGNVWEWCIDEIVKRNHPMRVTKGGACISPRGECLPEYQTQFSPEQASEYLGFRCCRTWKP